MKKKVRVIEREIQECLERSNVQLNRLRSIQTATKKRRALKRPQAIQAHEVDATSAKNCVSTPPLNFRVDHD
jgi:hypothetical protein